MQPVAVRGARRAGPFTSISRKLLKGRIYTIEFYYSGHPVEMGRFGGFVFRKDSMGRLQ